MTRCLCALAILGLTHAVPQTLQVFTSQLEQTVTTEATGINIEMVSEGTLYYDGRTRRLRQDFTTMKMTMSFDMGGGEESATEDPFADLFPDGIPGMSGDGIEMEMPGDGVTLLRYDLGKNFTWFSSGGSTECECSDIEGEFPPLFVDPTATGGTEESITVNEVAVTTDKWSSSLAIGGVDAGVAIDTSLTYYVEGGDMLRRMEYASNVGADGVGLSTSVIYDMWNIQDSVAEAKWFPHDSCTCPEPPTVNVQPASSYPEPTDTCLAESGCACLETTAATELEFCKDIVTWPVIATLFPVETDLFVKDAYSLTVDLLMTSESEECKMAYKEFLCQFYFQICKAGGLVALPEEFLSDSCTSGLTLSGAEGNTYTEATNLEEGNPASSGTIVNDISAASSSTGSLTGSMLVCMLMLLLGC